MHRLRKAFALAALATLVSSVLAVAAFGRPSATTAVAVTAGKPSEFKFTLSRAAGPRGAFVFTVTNRGKLGHDFKIAGKKTPVVRAGAKATLKVTILKPGKYQFLCTVAGHAPAGMKGTFTVR